MTEILYLIPARGGSKRIPKKNIRKLNGKPLIAYTIEEALKCNSDGTVVVSTDSKEIAEVSRAYGAEVVIRPKELATDESSTEDAVLHALDVLEKDGYIPDIIVVLQATSPLRKAEHIYEAVVMYRENEPHAVNSVSEFIQPVELAMKISNGFAISLMGWENFSKRSQQYGRSYAPNGAIYVVGTEYFKKNKILRSKTKMMLYRMPRDASVDIDTEEDWETAERLMKDAEE